MKNPKILDSSLKHENLEFLEMCHIYNADSAVNKRKDVDNLNTAYAAVLHTIKYSTTNTIPPKKAQITNSPNELL